MNDWLFTFDGISHIQWQSMENNYLGMALGDFDNDGIPEVFAGNRNGHIIAVDGCTHEYELDIAVSDSAIVGLYVYDIDQNGSSEIIFCSAGRISVFSLQDSSIAWQSDRIGLYVGEFNSILADDYDGDDRTEILVGVNHMVIEFEGPLCTYTEEIVDNPVHMIQISALPNPFTNTVEINYALRNPGWVSHIALVKIYDVSGRLVKGFNHYIKGIADYVTWHGDDNNGCKVPSGVYFCTIHINDYSAKQKIIKLE